MKTGTYILVIVFLVGFRLDAAGQNLSVPPNSVIERQVRLAAEVDKLLQRDQFNPPPPGGIEFIGSSIFRLWKHLGKQLAPLPVYNRAFGGSRTGEILFYMDTLVLRYRPSIIVYYCGSNDVNAGEPAHSIADRFIRFAERVRESDTATLVYYVSINKAPQKRDRWTVVDSTNAMVERYCEQNHGRFFVDVNPVLFDEEGNARLELYLEDQLHFRNEAYVKFADVLKPILVRAWQDR